MNIRLLEISRLLSGLLVVTLAVKEASSTCETQTVKGYLPESWNLVNTVITRTCGIDEAVKLPMDPPEENPSCEKCRDSLILKRIQGNSLPPSAFENYNTTTILYLNDLGIETISPGAFESLNSLKELHLGGNKLNEIVVGVLSSANGLVRVDLSSNRISSMKRIALDGTKHIESVNISSNLLTEIETKETWANISSLDLSHNSIKNVDIRSLPSNLTVLNLSSNALTSFDVHKNLTVLDLGNNLLTTFDFKPINYTMKKLNLQNNKISRISGTYCKILNVDLSGNKLTSVPCDCTNNSPQVEELNLANNQISNLMPQTISELTKLKILHLESNYIQTIKAGTFASLMNLIYLNISHNVIERFEMGSVDNIKNVETFDVSFNRLTQIKRYVMHTFANLKHLHLEYNNITYIDAANLDADLPKIWDINIVGNNLSCNNLWEIIRVFNKRPVHFPAGPYKNITNVHGISCYLKDGDGDDDFADTLDNEEINRGISDYFNHDYRESNFFKFLQEVQHSNMLVFNETHKMREAIKRLETSHNKAEHFVHHNGGGIHGYLVAIVLFLCAMTCCVALQGYVLYNKFRTRTDDGERLL